MQQMFTEISKISTIKYTFKNTERINGKFLSGEIQVTYNTKPKKIYILMQKPTQGVEILFQDGINNNSAIYSPNGFPFIKLYLDPYGDMMRKNNHHTIHEAGMAYMAKILKQTYTKYPSNFKYVGDVIWEGKNCHKIEIDILTYKIVSYTMKEKETIKSISKALNISDFKILELNNDIDEYNYSQTGKSIKIPSCYAKKMELYIDSETFLPVFQKIYDEKGLFEQYEYLNIEVNKKLNENVFLESNLGLIND
ncbi:MAG: hypothetical protein A2W98_07320 [Bacteroidetes bacterium GWF2_33_38]|nr:MAG: hypothetical protein A2W98_07320 [Bacteroidetes bacterium GWF2_33_38]OFY89950.1 MAG: hypothetical protein A2236_10780 [Bacteroidetes bacterium RIFOXYA2_FULL_33_7]